MSMFNDIVWDAKNEDYCENNSKKNVGEHARQFPRGDWSFLGLGSEKKWYGTYDGITKWILDINSGENPEHREIWSSCITLHQSHGKRIIKKQRGRKDNNTFTACEENVQLLLKMVMSVNQLSLYGTAADMIQEFT